MEPMKNKKAKVILITLILSSKTKPDSITIPGCKIKYRLTVVKTAWYWHAQRRTGQWNRRESPNFIHACTVN